MGNVVNRVFDSNGPEGKVRGTPQQIIDKYLQLARDAQLGNDRVAEQNFLQHAEHYTRMLGAAQREMAQQQEERQRQQQFQRDQRQNGDNGDVNNQRDDARQGEDDSAGLVETPETRAPRPAVEPVAAAPVAEAPATEEASAPQAPAAEDEAPAKKPRRPRAPRKPRAQKGEGEAPKSDDAA